MGCTVVLSDDQYRAVQGNFMTVALMGADVRLVEVEDHWDLEAASMEECEKLVAAGTTPHYIPVSGTTPMSCLGYISGGLELLGQLRERELVPDYVYTPFGTGGVFGATMTAFREHGVALAFRGVSVNRDEAICGEYLDKWRKPRGSCSTPSTRARRCPGSWTTWHQV
jgi:1-aminocyclopropane-1-carboxylate deaminase/D-cysteine desulfhydrase-like pyridoxal-dependent ACC family enzyme